MFSGKEYAGNKYCELQQQNTRGLRNSCCAYTIHSLCLHLEYLCCSICEVIIFEFKCTRDNIVTPGTMPKCPICLGTTAKFHPDWFRYEMVEGSHPDMIRNMLIRKVIYT